MRKNNVLNLQKLQASDPPIDPENSTISNMCWLKSLLSLWKCMDQ